MEKNSYNPDVLNCIANLSNDEVFTPPAVANRMLDLVPQELFSNPAARFLDPFCKSGVFLREIVKRLDIGLAEKIPDREERIAHIMHNQVYGIAITELTSLLARRTVYCCKDASGEHSVVRFDTPEGNIRFRAMRHTWRDGRCIYCGASQEQYERGEGRESYAYQFIHTEKPKNIFKMDFDVIIGNPPYQMSDGGGTGSSAMPIYQKFVQQAKKLMPNYLIMIIPSRWMTGGKHLDEFRNEMLNDYHLSILHDFIDARECFPTVSIEGGVCYFAWNKHHSNKCKVFLHQSDGKIMESERYLNDGGGDILIRDVNVISILQKVQEKKETSFETIVSTRNPFNIVGDINNYLSDTKTKRRILCRYKNKRSILFLKEDVVISRNVDVISGYKLFVSKADGAAGQLGNPIPARILGKPEIGEPNVICSETFLCVFVKSKSEAEIISGYMKTKFFRFLVGIRKNKNMTHETYSFVPLQDFSKPWTDEELYAKYGLTEEEIRFIESMIRPMED